MARAAAVEFGRHNLRVVAAAPGQMARYEPETGTNRPGPDPSSPLGQMGRPEDVAAAVAFLLSDDATHINGTQLTIDGGYLAAVGEWP